METPRTRFSPSPTGFLHIGGARTALYNWAFSRRHDGHFVLRIEDTDRERSTREAEAAVIEGLQWLGITWDEGPVRQSALADRHREAVERMLSAGRAYRCVCSAESLEERRAATIARGEKWTYDGRCRDADLGAGCGPHTVRLRMAAEGRLDWDDGVFGPSGQEAVEIGDRIIVRSDGAPLYHLAAVVDDLAMGITHVIRGADHLNNTSFHLALYRALDAEPPHFAHVPLIVGADGKKLSKRRDPVSVQHYRDAGFLPEALVNWLVRIGWSHGDDEIFSRDQIAELFSLEAVHRAPGRAEPEKLFWLNQHYLKERPRAELLAALAPFVEADLGGPPAHPERLESGVDLLRERSKTLVEMAERGRFLAVADDGLEYDEKAVAKHWKAAARPLLEALRAELAGLAAWDEAGLEAGFEAVRERQGVGLGKLAQPVRVAVTGSGASPGIYETLAVLGRDSTLARIDRALEQIPRA